MTSADTRAEFFKTKVLGHPAGLFVLFFTEMWERFSFYGMRVLLVNFLTMTLIGFNPGWEWSPEKAAALYGTYAMLLYVTPILGGIIADKYTGYRIAVVIGAAIMTLGHASMALDTEVSLYLGLALLVIGTGFFKPNITSIISEMYKDLPEKKDGAYTIFYMGVNAGAFFGMMLCGYLAERIGWSWGFGLAGIFMLLGTLQFWLAKPLFGSIGDKPGAEEEKEEEIAHAAELTEKEKEIAKPNPFTKLDYILIVISAIIGVLYAFNDPLSEIGGVDLFSFAKIGDLEGQYTVVLIGLLVFLILVISRIVRYARVVRDRMLAFIVFAFFTVFFWMSFEQGATSLVLFARDTVDRTLSGNSAVIFNIVNTLLTVVPLGIITYVLVRLFKQTRHKIASSNIVLSLCFAGIWAIVIWMLNRDFSSTSYDVTYKAIKEQVMNDKGKPVLDEENNPTYKFIPITEAMEVPVDAMVVDKTAGITELDALNVGSEVLIINKDKDKENFAYVGTEEVEGFRAHGAELNRDNGLIKASVAQINSNEVEITTSWFSILNSFFIIALASMFSKWWDSKYNPSAAMKYALGLIIMAVGFGLLAYGANVEEGVKVSMVWLILAYLFHTMGELCLSPVGLSYVSKLVPPRMIALMFGMWYLAIAIGNKFAAVLGGKIEKITEEYSLSVFFLIFTIVPIAAGLLIMALNPVLKKLMHGVR
ncbi:hypothetical protein NBRC110019_28230 [Neptunitalea chrysea]|uniref:MFS transporter n=1 Tax=Neptunitalea chrysea TaxID=1647581 RepID=A0A9W6EWE6_9FLAO|nr:peptide MFS transporter [Neptunitalea chrysea]GLB53782.1 hypothetical protein NBRC110019_28230 [Neptunitalea chrysea]